MSTLSDKFYWYDTCGISKDSETVERSGVYGKQKNIPG